jgi:hypothetical protein
MTQKLQSTDAQAYLEGHYLLAQRALRPAITAGDPEDEDELEGDEDHLDDDDDDEDDDDPDDDADLEDEDRDGADEDGVDDLDGDDDEEAKLSPSLGAAGPL